MGPSTSRNTVDPRYLTRQAAAAYLTGRGIPVQTETLARWACTGRYALPMIKLGTLVRYDCVDLDAFIQLKSDRRHTALCQPRTGGFHTKPGMVHDLSNNERREHANLSGLFTLFVSPCSRPAVTR